MSPWPQRCLGEVCTVVAGQSPEGTAYNDRGEGLPFYQGKKEFTERYLAPPSTWTTSITKRALPDDILMSVRAPVGPINVTQQEICIGRGLAAIRASSKIDNGFLWYALLWLQPKIVGNAGAVFPSINKKQIEALPLPLPPLEEQKRIVAVLDQAFAALDRARTLAEANLADAEAFLTGVLADALQENSQRWESYPLESLCIKGRKIGYGVLKPGRHDPQGVRLIKSQQVRDDSMDLTEDFRITKELDKQYARTRLQGGEILLNLVGASIGRSAIAPAELSGANISRAVAVLPVEPELAPWIQLNLRGPVGQRLIEEKTGGSAQPVLNLSEVKSLPIPLPSEKERADLLRKVENLSSMGTSLAQGYRTKIREVSDLRQSLLQKAFAGELT